MSPDRVGLAATKSRLLLGQQPGRASVPVMNTEAAERRSSATRRFYFSLPFRENSSPRWRFFAANDCGLPSLKADKDRAKHFSAVETASRVTVCFGQLLPTYGRYEPWNERTK